MDRVNEYFDDWCLLFFFVSWISSHVWFCAIIDFDSFHTNWICLRRSRNSLLLFKFFFPDLYLVSVWSLELDNHNQVWIEQFKKITGYFDVLRIFLSIWYTPINKNQVIQKLYVSKGLPNFLICGLWTSKLYWIYGKNVSTIFKR